ncbi:phosphatase PAP2 family protein [Aquirufa sp.]|jgi:undecaprenyl-diphosphatase|uniref:phosphatase PAP2 family protein n=1 Tax=Aquirufa sp. TaxID=2676249 RepID=UPI0037BE51AB
MFPAWDQNLFKVINEWHSNSVDPIMQFLSDKYVWIPLYAFLIWKLFQHNRKSIKASVFYLVLTIVWADQISSSILKPLVKRLRPSHVPEFQSWIHMPNGPGGLYGFCSSHAANAFAVAVGFYLLTRNKPLGIALLIWASLMAYSRIYLGVHYPLDVITGAVIGTTGAVILKQFVYDKLVKN